MAITDIVKCEDEKEFLIWKYPEEIFKTTTKLIVGAGKEAVFYKKGNSYDVLPEGEYVLKITNSSKFVKYATTFDEYENEVDLKKLTTHNVDISRYEELPKMKNVCKNCGTILPEGAAFCFKCGEKTNNW